MYIRSGLVAFLLTLFAAVPSHAAQGGSVPDSALQLPADRALVAAPGDLPRAEAARIDTLRMPIPAADSARTVDYLWVLRTAILRREAIPALVSRAREMGVRGLLVQVVGRGDAYYRSRLLPAAEALAPALRDDPGFDPLAEVVTAAHAAGLEVHAWVNCMLVWSSPDRPRDARHVLNAHPDWVACMPGGRRMSRLSVGERVRLKLEGVYLAPANPGVHRFVAGIAAEIARNYAVDGIHLDYIRQPGVAIGYDGDTRMRFAIEHGVDPIRLASLPAPRRDEVQSQWASFQRDRLTALVRDVRDSLAAVRAGVSLSAAVLADTLVARERNAQDWTEWVRDGLIDRAFVMCYAAPVQTVMDEMVTYAEALGLGGRVVPGIAVYNTAPALAAAKMLGARALGYPRLALYSYDSLEESSSYWTVLREALDAAGHGRP